MAKARGLDAVLLDYLFVVVATLVVVASLKMIGALLVLVLIVVPAAAAQNIAKNLQGFFWISVLFATLSSVFGLIISGVWPIPTGGAIVLVASVLFYGTLLSKPFLGRLSIQQGEL
jgi:zinc transport system permease protein